MEVLMCKIHDGVTLSNFFKSSSYHICFRFCWSRKYWAKYKDFNPFQVKRSAGFGFSILTNVWFIRLQFRLGFDNIPGNPGSGNGKGQFHFTLGAQLGEL